MNGLLIPSKLNVIIFWITVLVVVIILARTFVSTMNKSIVEHSQREAVVVQEFYGGK